MLDPKSQLDLSPKADRILSKKSKAYRSDTGMGLKSQSLLKNSNASVRKSVKSR
jgi:hypothetical protein